MQAYKSAAAFAVLVWMGLLGGCALSARGPSVDGRSDISINQILKAVEAKKNDYTLAPRDKVEVSVYQEDDIDRLVLVDQNGVISLPMIGAVKVGGLTLFQAQSKLTHLFGEYLVEPYVSIQVKEYHSSKIFIMGEVVKSGSYDLPLDHPLTALEAIALAGGFSKMAAEAKTRVLRQTNGQMQVLLVPVPEIVAGNKDKDIPLQRDDVVFVPQRVF